MSDALIIKLITSGVKKLYICLDNDALKAALGNAELLMKHGIEVYLVELPGKDPSELGYDKVNALILETPPLTFRRIIEYKLKL